MQRMSVAGCPIVAPRRQARIDAAVSLLAVMLVHAAVFMTVSAQQAEPLDLGTPTLVQAQVIVDTPVRPQPPAPPVKAEPEPPRPQPPKAVERPKPKRLVAQTPAEPRSTPDIAVAPESEPPSTPPPPASAAPSPPAPIAPPRFDAAYLDNPAPQYPAISRRLREEGKVMLRVFVEPDGSPSQVNIHQASGFARLDRAALDAVRHWRFVPARQGAEQIGAWVLVPIAFSLRS